MIATVEDHLQPELFRPLVEPDVHRDATIQDKFLAFHEANPWVLDAYVRELRRARERGFRRIGMKFITELLRWQYAAHTNDPNSGFKLCNNYPSRYAREIIRLYPEFDSFITLRELTAL